MKKYFEDKKMLRQFVLPGTIVWERGEKFARYQEQQQRIGRT